MSDWIKVIERLPARNAPFVVDGKERESKFSEIVNIFPDLDGQRNLGFCWLDCGRWELADAENTNVHPTHWQPLPDPPSQPAMQGGGKP